MSQKNPIKFLDSYSRDDKDIFFGRDKETLELYDKVGKSKVVLLYGLSGTGKTSLINCGLENKYEENQRIFIYVRRGNNINNSFRQALTAEASSLIHPNAGPAEALETVYYDFLKPLTIIFDQFEELFISGDYDEKHLFINTISDILQSELKVKFIFSLREEYLAYMDEFEEKIPIIYDHRYRLEKMRRATLEEVITKIVEKGGASLESDQIPSMIIDSISDRKGNVELPYLQVYLDKLTRLMVSSSGDKVFTEQLVKKAGELEDVLGDFLEEQIARIASEAGSREAINNILKQLITPDGTKKQLSIDEVKPFGKGSIEQIKEILAKLEESRIVKLEDGIYELSHDSLAKKIAEKRSSEELRLIEIIKFLRNASQSYRQTETLLDRKQLKYVQPFLHLIDLSADEKELLSRSWRKVRTRKVIFWLCIAAAFVALLLWGYNYQQRSYQDFMDKATVEMNNANYFDAKLNFQRALDVIHFIDKDEAKANILRCDTLIDLEKPYKQHIISGDSLFNLGVSHFRSAFYRYHAAKHLEYNPGQIDQLIEDRAEDASRKYVELAKMEYDSKHLDIAMVLVAESFILYENDSNRDQLIDKWLGKVKEGDLDLAIDQLQNTANYHNQELERAAVILDRYRKKQESFR